jgi:uncharacterized protein
MHSAPQVALLINGQTTPYRIAVANTWWRRAVGLLGTSALQDEPCGLWIAPCSSIHMLGMRYAIDVVFLDAHGLIQKMVPQLKPWRFAACWRAHSTLELRAGLCEVMQLQLGQCLELWS